MNRYVPRIVAIGGGNLGSAETPRIEMEIIGLTGKKRPRALFVPTASGDSEDYIAAFQRHYGEKLGCIIDVLRLAVKRPSFDTMKRQVMESDFLYVGGGNSYRMLRTWRQVRFDRILKEASHTKVVLSGVSAGAVCWFDFGHSDSQSYWHKKDWKFMRLRGLGIVNMMFCPHYHSERRESSLESMLLRSGGRAIACDDNAALAIVGKQFKIVTSCETARAYFLSRDKRQVVRQPLRADGSFRPLQDLTEPYR